MVTLRTPKAWPGYAARWFRERVQAPFASGVSAGAVRRQWRVTSASLGLSALVGLTTLAVAWVSLWWVPAYLSLMVLIFVTPHDRGGAKGVVESDRGSLAELQVDPGSSLRIDRTDEVAHNHLDVGSIGDSFLGESTPEGETPHLGLTSSSTTRGRRTRGRVRKTAKPASERATESASVVWIRVGPGKFVRAEGGSEAVLPAQEDQASEDVDAGQDGTIGEIPALTVSDHILEDNSSESTVADFGERVSTGGSDDDCVGGSIAGVYGIAPSTFGSFPSESRLDDGLKSRVPNPGITTHADCMHALEVSEEPPAHSHDNSRPLVSSKGRLTGIQMYRFSRRIANTVRGGYRASLHCDVRKGPKGRAVIRRAAGLNGRYLGQVMYRAFGRISHHQRALRPRSPPFGE